jgi:hypothetical protein
MHTGKQLWRNWEESFRALIDYKKRHGDCNVPKLYHRDLVLAKWVRKQRKNRFTELTPKQRSRLDEIGFDWETLEERLERQWNENFKKLTAYQQEYLDCCVPFHYKQDPELGTWVATQQSWHARGRIRPDRQRQLESIGFTWSRPKEIPQDSSEADKKWLKNYSKLVDVSREHGHCIVPNDYEKDEYLCHWVNAQHICHAQDILSPHRKVLLDEIGFVWRVDNTDAHASLSQQRCDGTCERRVQFKEANGIRHPKGVPKIFQKWKLGNGFLNRRAESKKEKLEPRLTRRLDTTKGPFTCFKPHGETKFVDPKDDAIGCISIWRKRYVGSTFVDSEDESFEARDENEAAEIEYGGV